MTQYVDPYATRLAQLRRQAETLANTPPETQMYSPEEQARRSLELKRMQVLGQLGGISNDKAVMNISEPLLKRAMEAQKPKYTEHGAFDETTGTHTYFPNYLSNRKLERVDKNLAATETASARAQEQWNRDRARAQEQANLRMTLLAMRAGQGGDSDKGSLSFTGTTTDTGQPIFMHSKRGPMIKDATGAMIPYSGRIGPKSNEPSNTEQQAYHKNRAGNANVTSALAAIDANPDAVGPVAVLPPWISQRVPESIMKGGESGVQTRAIIGNISSMKIHDRTGAAAPVGEMERLKPFIPDLRWDSPKAIRDKLASFRLEYNAMLKEIEDGHPLSIIMHNNRSSATKPIGGLPPGQTTAPAAPNTDDALINKYLNPTSP